VNLCVLPCGEETGKGGVSQVDSLGDSSAFGLRVLLTGPHTVTLVWQHTTAASESGPEGDEIATTTSSGGPLTAQQDVATAPSFGTMSDATVGPQGTIWVVSEIAGDKPTGHRQGRLDLIAGLRRLPEWRHLVDVQPGREDLNRGR
jgi:hypothetical protein